MDIRPAEISEILKKQIAAFDTEANVAETGQVLSVGDGIARVFGLQNVMSGEMVLFPSMSAYMSEIAPPAQRGEYMGLYTMTFSVAFMIGPWLGTWGLESLGATWFWLATFAAGLVSTLIFAKARNATPQS